MSNYLLWGGRLNPFIPVSDSIIDADFMDLLVHLDPDLIYYSTNCDKNKLIDQLPFLHPIEFVEMPTEGGMNLPGLYSGYLVTNELQAETYSSSEFAIAHIAPGINHPLASFFQLSFGFSPMFVEDKIIAKNYKALKIDENDLSNICATLRIQKPFLTCLLSEEKCSQITFRAENDWEAQQIELIVYEPDNAFCDIIYFWNRRLFQNSKRQLRQLLISRTQLLSVASDKEFQNYLYETLFSNHIALCSKSIITEKLRDLCSVINEKTTRIKFHLRDDINFPYTFDRVGIFSNINLNRTKIVFRGDADYLPIPPPLISLNTTNLKANYLVDVELVSQADLFKNHLKFPFHTNVRHLVSSQPSRINRENNISFLVNAYVDKGFDITIPSHHEIIRSRIIERQIFKDAVKTPIGYPRISTAGLKLRSFIELFNEKWHNIEYIISDSFYLRLCLRTSLFSNSKGYRMERIANGKSEFFHVKLPDSNICGSIDSFNQLDLKNELKHYYLHYKKNIVDMFNRENVALTDDELINFIEKAVKEDFDVYINNDLQDLVEQKALYMGMRVKCNNCGANYWYSLKHLDNHMSCEGCHKQISPSVNAPIAYKFNSVIVNNLRSNSTVNKMSFDGNYVVLQTLIYLSTKNNTHNSFMYSPCLDIEIYEGEKKTATDLDILAVVNGRLIVGEAKVQAADFNKKQLDQLIWVGKNIRPDKIILAYLEGKSLNDKIEIIKNAINDPLVKVISYKVPKHWHRFGRIFGSSEERENYEE